MESKVVTPAEIFGEYVFNDSVMGSYLTKNTHKALKKTIEMGSPIDSSIADEVASAMKNWAIEKGATHYTHWFMPMTGMTAEKHDSFISPTEDGKVVLEFSGRELIKGETDASSFPSGGLRHTAKARGYTAWDCTSPAFVKEGTLYIPTAFFSYTGEILDKKAPLLRSVEALSRQAMRVLKAFGNETSQKVIATVGPEQEYFLINRELYEKRLDLMLTGRTLFGSKPPKGQELEDQYFARIRIKIMEFMRELDWELWKLGITARTKHNEVAPAQHELAIIFDPASMAADHNQLVMEIMRKTAKKHGLAALLHEKPFAGVNGSGKHVNWSIATDDGINLLDPGMKPAENTQFFIFIVAVMKAVDEYADLLRLSIACAGNDHRLGAHEAPPAIVSMFVGEELEKIMDAIENGHVYESVDRAMINIGISSLPMITEDATDRNRTSPFAFTGNKFEFRMCGSSANIAEPCFTLNTIVAETLEEITKKLEKAADVQKEANKIIKEIIIRHKRIIFNGNNYDPSWVEEAQKRGLPNIGNTVFAIEVLKDKKNIAVFEKQGVLSHIETESRYEIMLDIYSKTINIEAQTLANIVNRQILPAVISYSGKLAADVTSLKSAGIEGGEASCRLNMIVSLANNLGTNVNKLLAAAEKAGMIEDPAKSAMLFLEKVVPELDATRAVVDELETIIPADVWPVPVYTDLLFRV